jgi:purine-binding chemotaxis protein CheW
MSPFSHSESFVLFELAGSTCGVSSKSVESVEMVEGVTAVPKTLPFVEGVTLTRGRFIPSINLRIRFGLPRVPVDPKGRMLVVRSKNRTAGMLVDGVREFVFIHADAIQPQDPSIEITASGFSTRFVDRIATLENREILILNIEKIIGEA